jgi:hypothetical protein
LLGNPSRGVRMNLGTLKSKMARANFAGGPKCTFWAHGVHTVGSCQHASSRHGLPRPCQLASFCDFGLFLGGRACRGNAKAWAGQAKACDAKAMPWLPRHVLPRQCHGCQDLSRPRYVLPRQCHGLPRPRHVLPRQCHGLPRPRHVLPRQCHGLPRLATAKACAA